jgi:hypothetical protein
MNKVKALMLRAPGTNHVKSEVLKRGVSPS